MAVNFGSSGDFRRGRDLGLQGAIATSQNNREVEEEFNLKQAGRINSFNVNLVAKLQKQFGTDHPLVDEHIAAGSVPTWNTLNAIYPDAGASGSYYGIGVDYYEMVSMGEHSWYGPRRITLSTYLWSACM